MREKMSFLAVLVAAIVAVLFGAGTARAQSGLAGLNSQLNDYKRALSSQCSSDCSGSVYSGLLQTYEDAKSACFAYWRNAEDDPAKRRSETEKCISGLLKPKRADGDAVTLPTLTPTPTPTVRRGGGGGGRKACHREQALLPTKDWSEEKCNCPLGTSPVEFVIEPSADPLRAGKKVRKPACEAQARALCYVLGDEDVEEKCPCGCSAPVLAKSEDGWKCKPCKEGSASILAEKKWGCGCLAASPLDSEEACLACGDGEPLFDAGKNVCVAATPPVAPQCGGECPTFGTVLRCWWWVFIVFLFIFGGPMGFALLHFRKKWEEAERRKASELSDLRGASEEALHEKGVADPQGTLDEYLRKLRLAKKAEPRQKGSSK